MQITLIDPLMDYRAHCVSETLGLMYIAAVLREAGHGVRIVATGLREDNNLQPSDIMDADLVGVTSTSALFPKAQAVLSTIRSWRPELPVMLGGAHATICTEHGLRSGFDWAVIGEAEKTIVEFAANLERGCPRETRGIAFIDETDSVHKTPAQDLIEDLDTLPFPARDLYDYDAFRAHGGWEFGMLSSRGCPFKCTFCQPTLNMIFGHMRKRGPENVAAEMAELAEHYNPPILYFKDDTLSANGMKWFDRFRAALAERDVKLQWKCNTRVDKVGPRILDAMQEAGCVEVVFGVESGSQRILDFYKKGIEVEDTIRAFDLCRERGIRAGANVILGAPMETSEEMEQTYQLMERIQPDHFWVFFATALPGKDLTKYVVEHNLLKRNLGYHYYDTAMNGVYGSANIELESISYEQMVAMRNRILGLQQGSNQEETALRHGIPQHAPQRTVRR
ncbi:MAG: B12-binding domain-containing radical SAM protein [Myxococcota bacterium]